MTFFFGCNRHYICLWSDQQWEDSYYACETNNTSFLCNLSIIESLSMHPFLIINCTELLHHCCCNLISTSVWVELSINQAAFWTSNQSHMREKFFLVVFVGLCFSEAQYIRSMSCKTWEIFLIHIISYYIYTWLLLNECGQNWSTDIDPVKLNINDFFFSC